LQEAEYYKITQVIEPNVIEVEGTWFVKLKGVSDFTPQEEIKKWLKQGNIVRVIPYRRNNDARIISDVWLGNTHINRQFVNYKRDNFIQAFEHWKNVNSERFSLEEDELTRAFNIVEPEIKSPLKDSFKKWMESRYPQRSREFSTAGEISINRERLKDEMIKDFNQWK